MADPTIPHPVRDRHPMVQRAYVATEVNQASHCHADHVERAVIAALDAVVFHLTFVDWQEDTAADAVAALRADVISRANSRPSEEA